MLINLLPDFFAVLESTDRLAAYERYFTAHQRVLGPYWNNYIVPPEGGHFRDILRTTMAADRADLQTMLERVDVVSVARRIEETCVRLLDADVDFDIVLMVGVGGANAGELVVNGRGAAFICVEHFTGVVNPDTFSLGLDPELIGLWLAHEIAHVIRYTSPASRSDFHSLVEETREYSFWDTGRRIALRELLLNEGLAVHASRLVSPGHAAWEYFGYTRRQYARIRQLEPVLYHAAEPDFNRSALGLRMQYLSDGMNEHARIAGRVVLPERSGYYLGACLSEGAITTHGLPWSLRASAFEILALSTRISATAS